MADSGRCCGARKPLFSDALRPACGAVGEPFVNHGAMLVIAALCSLWKLPEMRLSIHEAIGVCLGFCVYCCDQRPSTRACWRSGRPVSTLGRRRLPHTEGHGATQSSTIVYEIEPGGRLGWHTDATEETQYILAGNGELRVEDGSVHQVGPGSVCPRPRSGMTSPTLEQRHCARSLSSRRVCSHSSSTT